MPVEAEIIYNKKGNQTKILILSTLNKKEIKTTPIHQTDGNFARITVDAGTCDSDNEIKIPYFDTLDAIPFQ